MTKIFQFSTIALLSIFLAVAGCKSKKETTKNEDDKTEATEQTEAEQEKKVEAPKPKTPTQLPIPKGTEMMAQGFDPEWRLLLDYEDQITLLIGDKKHYFKINDPVHGEGIRRYISEKAKDKFVLELYSVECEEQPKPVEGKGGVTEEVPTDAQKKPEPKKYPLTVVIRHNDSIYNGCGGFLDPVNKINGKWVVYTIYDVSYPVEEKQEEAFIKFDIDKGTMHGHTGCNTFSTTFEGGDRIFRLTSPIQVSKNSCPDDREKMFLDALKNTRGFILQKNMLQLVDPEGQIITLMEDIEL